MSASDYLEKKILDHTLGIAAYTMPAAVYLALFTSDPGEAGGGTEVSGAGYARQSITFGAAAPVSGDMTSLNSQARTFTPSGGNYGTVTHWALFDAASGGNMLYYAPMTTPRTVNDGQPLLFATGALAQTAD